MSSVETVTEHDILKEVKNICLWFVLVLISQSENNTDVMKLQHNASENCFFLSFDFSLVGKVFWTLRLWQFEWKQQEEKWRYVSDKRYRWTEV